MRCHASSRNPPALVLKYLRGHRYTSNYNAVEPFSNSLLLGFRVFE